MTSIFIPTVNINASNELIITYHSNKSITLIKAVRYLPFIGNDTSYIYRI